MGAEDLGFSDAPAAAEESETLAQGGILRKKL